MIPNSCKYGELTVANTMAFLFTVVALDNHALSLLLLLSAVLHSVSNLVAVVALGEATVNDLTGVLQPFHVLLI